MTGDGILKLDASRSPSMLSEVFRLRPEVRQRVAAVPHAGEICQARDKVPYNPRALLYGCDFPITLLFQFSGQIHIKAVRDAKGNSQLLFPQECMN